MEKYLAILMLLFSHIGHAAPIEGRNLLGSGVVVVDPAKSKGAVVVFLSSKCPCSHSHVGELSKLSKEYPEFNFLAVHSNGDEEEADAKSYFASNPLPFPVIQDDGAKLADRFGAQKTPHAFVVLPNDSIAFQGGVSNSNDFSRANKNYLRIALSDLRAGRKVATPEGRALGCFIVRNK